MRRAAIVAAFFLALPASAAAEPSWLSPVPLSSTAENATQPDVAVDGDGDATAVWLYQSNGTANVVQASTHAPQGSWTTPVDLSVTGENAQSPEVAADANGDVAAVWLRSNGSNNIVQVATKPAGGSWSAPVSLSAAGEDADSPRVALDASGDVFVAWDRSDGSNDRLQATVETAGTWGATQTLSVAGESANLYDLKVNSAGTAMVVWDLYDASGDYVVQVSTYTTGTWSAAQSLTGATGEAGTPSLALDAAGDATVAWEQRQPDLQFLIESSSRPAGGSWSSPSVVSGEGGTNTFAVADSSGNAFVAWDQLTSDMPQTYEAQASVNGATGTTLDSESSSLGSIAVSSLQSDASGNAAALMIKSPNAGASVAEVAYYNAGASGWSAPVEIASYPGTGFYFSALALEADENGVAVWEAEISGVSVIEAAISSNTTITSGPPSETNQPSASVSFSSTEPDPSFRCSLDGGPFVACSSPATYTGLANGQHTFAVEATDSQGNVDLAPVVTSWNVDAPPVDVVSPTISGAVMQGQPLSESHGSWSNAPTGYSYQWEDCDSAGTHCAAIGGATNQTYTLGASDVGATIRVVETASNTGGAGSPASSNATATVSAASAGTGSAGGGQGEGGSGSGGGQTTGRPAAPKIHIVSAQISSKHRNARFHFEATGESTGFQCALVRKPSRNGTKTPRPKYVSCGSAKTFKHLKAGKYELYVRAVGPGGTEKTPATYKFKIT